MALGSINSKRCSPAAAGRGANGTDSILPGPLVGGSMAAESGEASLLCAESAVVAAANLRRGANSRRQPRLGSPGARRNEWRTRQICGGRGASCHDGWPWGMVLNNVAVARHFGDRSSQSKDDWVPDGKSTEEQQQSAGRAPAANRVYRTIKQASGRKIATRRWVGFQCCGGGCCRW